MKTLAVIITRYPYNHVLQACEWIGLALESGVRVSVLFRDEAAARVTIAKGRDLVLSGGYRGRESRVRELLKERKQDDFPALLRNLKEKGDLKLSVCRDSLALFELAVEDLFPEIDEVQRVDAFWKEAVLSADRVLTF